MGHGESVNARLNPTPSKRAMKLADLSPSALRVIASMVRDAYFQGYDDKRRNQEHPSVIDGRLSSTAHNYMRQEEWSQSDSREELLELTDFRKKRKKSPSKPYQHI